MEIELDLKPSVANWLIIGLMAITFIVLAKFVVNRFVPIQSVKDFVNSV